MTPVPPLTATITTAAPIVWSNGSSFTGWLLIGMALPTNASGVQYATVNFYGLQPAQTIPTWCMVPIVEGAVNQNVNVFFSNQVEPPNTKYVFYWLDATLQQIYPTPGNVPALVTVLTNPYVIAAPTLIIPTTPTAIPAPQSTYTTPNSGVQVNYATPAPETLGGVVNGTNTVFTLSRIPLVAVILVDGQVQDQSSYSLTGSTVTFVIPPTLGASVTAWLF